MQANDIIEIEEKEYLVIDVFELEGSQYALLNVIQEDINPEDTMVVKVKNNMVYSIDEEEEAKKVIKYLDSKASLEE